MLTLQISGNMNYTYQNAKGYDNAIQSIQDDLSDGLIIWGDINIFGRAYKNKQKSSKKNNTPEAYIGNGEYRDVLTDDKVNAILFFIEDDEHDSSNGFMFKNKTNLVVIANLSKIFNNNDYREDIRCEEQVLKILQRRGIQVLKIKKDIKTIFKDFYSENITLSNMEPYHCFSLEFDLNYNLDC